MTTLPPPPLSNLQVELLKLYSKGIPDEHLNELKVVIATFLLQKARKKINEIAVKKQITQQTIDQLLISQLSQ
jgi:hypothetical protein